MKLENATRPTPRFHVILAAALSAVLGGCGVPGPGGPENSFGLDFSLPPGSRTDGAIVFVVDGLNAEIFDRMLQAGELPAARKYFVERGLYAPCAVANVPSVTLANLASLATGIFPGHHDVMGVNWFDRNTLIWRNYETIAQKNALDGDCAAANLFERFPDRTTFSVFFQPHRGATKFVENWTSAGPPFFFGWYEFVDRLTLSRFDLVMDVARKRSEMPAVTVAYLLAPDFRAYGFGVKSAEYREAIRHADRQIGRVLGDLERAGLLDKTVIALCSDHSLGEVTRHFPLEAFLREQVGLDLAPRRLADDVPFERRLDHYRQYPAVTCGSGDRYWAIHLRKPARGAAGGLAFEPWPVRPTAVDLSAFPVRTRSAWSAGPEGAYASPSVSPERKDILSALVEQEAVDAVAYAAVPDRVRVRRKAGEVEFRQDGRRDRPVTYHVVSGTDPLGWADKVPADLLAGEPAAPRRWLEATAGTDWPDLPAQILAYFRSRRAGDVAVFAAPGWDFNNVHRAGHGGLRPEDLLTPLLIAGPGVPRGTLPVARTVDLVPTLLHLLGRPAAGLDGQPMVRP